MIIDKLLSPAIAKDLDDFTVSTQVIGEVMDFGAARNNGLLATPYGPGWVIRVSGATSGGASTLTLQLVTDDNAALSSPTTLWASTAYALNAIDNEGVEFFLPVPETDLWERYAAFRAVVGTAVYTGGKLSIEFAANARKWRAYPSTSNV